MYEVLVALATYHCLHTDFFFNQAFLVIFSRSFGLVQSVPTESEAKSTFFIITGEDKILIIKPQPFTGEKGRGEQ